jgi:Ca2+-binding EF-hand superfamily protein
MRRFLPLTALVLVLAAGSAAIAQQPGGPGPKFGRGHGHGPAGFGLLEFDANADGKLTKAEFDTAQRAHFDQMDANKDGFFTPEEVQASLRARRADMEKQRFAALDTDKNGQLSQPEFEAARERGPGSGPGGPPVRMGGRGGPDGPGRPGGFGGRGGRAGPDADNDGKVSFAEFSARGSDAFTRADSNKDGTVTIAELQDIARRPR